METMIAKDFIEALNEAGYDFEIFGWEGILNLICLHGREQAKYYSKKAEMYPEMHYDNLAKWETDRAEKLHDILRERRYFS